MKGITLLPVILSLLFITNCSDPCEDVQCLHNGICESGDCDCTERYTGRTCAIEVTPSAVKLRSFAIKAHEINPNGDPWDDEPGIDANPDMYIKIFDENNEEFRNTEDFVTTNIQQLTLFFEVEITDITKTFRIEVFDDDGVNDQLIYSLPFTPYTEGLNFPDKITEIYNAVNIPPTENGELTISLDYCF